MWEVEHVFPFRYNDLGSRDMIPGVVKSRLNLPRSSKSMKISNVDIIMEHVWRVKSPTLDGMSFLPGASRVMLLKIHTPIRHALYYVNEGTRGGNLQYIASSQQHRIPCRSPPYCRTQPVGEKRPLQHSSDECCTYVVAVRKQL